MRWTPFYQVSELLISYLFAGLVGAGIVQQDWASVGFCTLLGIGCLSAAAESVFSNGWLGRRS